MAIQWIEERPDHLVAKAGMIDMRIDLENGQYVCTIAGMMARVRFSLLGDAKDFCVEAAKFSIREAADALR